MPNAADDALVAPDPSRNGAPFRRQTRAWWCWALSLAIAAGIFLRWTQLRTQVLLDDEWHAIHKLLNSDVAGIFTSFGLADHSIPLTLYFRFLAHHGGLTEWVMHLPLLIAGVLLLFVAPLSLRRQASFPVLVTWVGLLAISPLHVYLTRTARPYALTCLLCFAAVLSFRRWWYATDASRFWGASYVGATFFAGWLHLITLPFTFLPFIYYALHALISRARSAGTNVNVGHQIRRLILLGCITTVPLAAVLAPPVMHDWAQLAEKASVHSVSLESTYRTLLMLYGISSPLLLAFLITLTIVGGYRWWLRDADFVGYLLFIGAGTAAAIIGTHPLWIHHPGVLARYMLPALPFLLLFLAEGTVAVIGKLRPPRLVEVGAVTFLTALLWLAGPMRGYLYSPDQFMGHLRFQFDYDPAHNPYILRRPHDPIPPFYYELARRPPRSLTLIEAPWRLESDFNPHPWYQEIHRQYVKIGLVTPVCGERNFGEFPATATGLHFRYLVHLSEMLAGRSYGADYLIVHLRPWKTPPDASVEWPDMAACLPKITDKFGPAVYRDDTMVVFDLTHRSSPVPLSTDEQAIRSRH